MDTDEPALRPGAPPKPPAQAELTDEYAMALAEYWYSAYGMFHLWIFKREE